MSYLRQCSPAHSLFHKGNSQKVNGKYQPLKINEIGP